MHCDKGMERRGIEREGEVSSVKAWGGRLLIYCRRPSTAQC
jgi:hypothetical protein